MINVALVCAAMCVSVCMAAQLDPRAQSVGQIKGVAEDNYAEKFELLLTNDAVRFRKWYGRTGNNVHQLVHVLFLAEATGRKKACFPHHDRVGIGLLLDTNGGGCIDVDPNERAQSRRSCLQLDDNQAVNKYWFHMDSILNKDQNQSVPCLANLAPDFSRLALTYLKSRFRTEVMETCALEGSGFDGLTVHLRSGDLLRNIQHVQSHLAPCAFPLLVIKNTTLQKVRIITESDLAHPCIAMIKEGVPPGVSVEVQSGSLIEDICALMTARNVLHGAHSTFSVVFAWLLNENDKNVFWLRAHAPPFVRLDHRCQVDPHALSTSCRRVFMYEIPGIDAPRSSVAKKMKYMKQLSEDRIVLDHVECSQDC